MVRRLAPVTDPDLLVGVATGDDAAVWRLDDQRALVVTADFITPVVGQSPYRGVVAGGRSHQQVGVFSRVELAQYLHQVAGGQLAASTGAVAELGQSPHNHHPLSGIGSSPSG